MPAYDIFISYSRKDSAIAERICRAFDKAGISYFIDKKGIGGGMEFPAVLADAICDSHLFLYLASENSYSSKFTNNEITFAFNEKPRESILPYIIDGSELPRQMRFIFAGINWRTLAEHPIETVLVEDLKNLLGKHGNDKDDIRPQAPAAEYSPLSKDISICYEKDGYLYMCLAGSGRKLKIDIQYGGLRQDEILKRIVGINIKDADSSKGSSSPGLDYINANFEQLKAISGISIIAQNNPESFASAYRLQKRIMASGNRKCYVRMAPSMYALGAVGSYGKAPFRGAIRFGTFEVNLECGDGVVEIGRTIRSRTTESIDISNLVKGLVLQQCILKDWAKDYLLLDTVGIPLRLSRGNFNLEISEDTTIPTRASDESDKEIDSVDLLSGDYIIEKNIPLRPGKNPVTAEVWADHSIRIY